MILHPVDDATFQVENTLEVAPGLALPCWVRFDRTNAAWLGEQAARFARNDAVDPACSTDPDRLTARVGGTDQDPCLIVQNTHQDGSSRGTIYLSEEEARALAEALGRLP